MTYTSYLVIRFEVSVNFSRENMYFVLRSTYRKLVTNVHDARCACTLEEPVRVCVRAFVCAFVCACVCVYFRVFTLTRTVRFPFFFVISFLRFVCAPDA